jgi:hypothetical protein
MVVVPLSKPAKTEASATFCGVESCNLVNMAAVASLAAGGVLLATGKRRAGLVAAVAGTAMAMIDQQEVVREWWNALPGYLANLQELVVRVQGVVDDISENGEKLQKIFKRQA